jgi:hypothetical protein
LSDLFGVGLLQVLENLVEQQIVVGLVVAGQPVLHGVVN